MSVSKMVLVPEGMVELNPVPHYVSRISNQCQSVLSQPGLSADQKAALYDQMFLQQQALRDQYLNRGVALQQPLQQIPQPPAPPPQLSIQKPLAVPAINPTSAKITKPKPKARKEKGIQLPSRSSERIKSLKEKRALNRNDSLAEKRGLKWT